MAGPVAIDDDAFDTHMAALGPFEQRPHIAAGVSGGADSLALALLADAWARRRGGSFSALTVDHGLRAGSDAEAQTVAGWLGARGIRSHILTNTAGTAPRSLQAAARSTRYALLLDWCRRNHVLHLLLAHHREDQAETLLLRLGRGSGVDGLSGMAPMSERPGVRLLRPLLNVPHGRLEATLRACGQNWVEDPSNRDPAFGRVRVRNLLPSLAAEGLTAERLAATAGRLSRARAALETSTADLLARSVMLDAAGYAILDSAILRTAPEEIGLRALARLLRTIAGGDYPPRHERLERLYAALMAGPLRRGRTLAGCRVLPVAQAADKALICREPSAVADDLPLRKGGIDHWDGRYQVTTKGSARGLSIGALGSTGWSALVRGLPKAKRASVPAPARPTLPVLRDAAGIVAVPHLGFRRPDAKGIATTVIRYRPGHPLAGASFGKTVVL